MSNDIFVYRPGCQATTPSECSNCHLSYDCVRARSGRKFAWGIIVLGAMAVSGILLQVLV